MAKGVAEIALLLVLFESGVIGQDIFSLFVLMMFGYIMLMPQAIDFAINKARKSHQPKPPGAVPLSFARRALEDITVNTSWTERAPIPNSALSIRILSMTGSCRINRTTWSLMEATLQGSCRWPGYASFPGRLGEHTA